MQSSEFTVQNAYRYDHRGPLRWIISHVWRYKLFVLGGLGGTLGGSICYSAAQRMIGTAAGAIIAPTNGPDPLPGLALAILGLLLAEGLLNLTGSLSSENVAARVEADAREELYRSLLGKNQTFHDRQRTGDIMAAQPMTPAG